MAGFTEVALSKKLEDLNASQQSIQTLSLWLIHHRKHHAAIVKTWTRELISADESRQLTLMYLANDVIQNSRKKGPEYGKEFGTVLKKAFEIMGGDSCSEKTQKSLFRLLGIWEERAIYDKKAIEEFKKALGSGATISSPPKKKVRIAKEIMAKKRKEKIKVARSEEPEPNNDADPSQIMYSPKQPAIIVNDSPEPEELIKTLMELENSATSDAAVREKIASYPPEVSDVNLIREIEDRKTGEDLLRKVCEAVSLLADYNTRLVTEMGQRKRATILLKDFIQSQRDLLEHAENNLEEYKEKLKKICSVRNELKSKLSTMPDLNQLPDVTGSLPPLPSAGDLFSMQ